MSMLLSALALKMELNIRLGLSTKVKTVRFALASWEVLVSAGVRCVRLAKRDWLVEFLNRNPANVPAKNAPQESASANQVMSAWKSLCGVMESKIVPMTSLIVWWRRRSSQVRSFLFFIEFHVDVIYLQLLAYSMTVSTTMAPVVPTTEEVIPMTTAGPEAGIGSSFVVNIFFFFSEY